MLCRMSIFPDATDRTDPINKVMGVTALALIAVVVPLVVLVQQTSRSLMERSSPDPVVEWVQDESASPEPAGEFTTRCQIVTKINYELRFVNAADRATLAEDEESRELVDPARAMKMIDSIAISRTDRLRAAIVAGELVGVEEANRRLAKLEEEVTPGSELLTDVQWIHEIYKSEQGGSGVPRDAREWLVSRHGWFGEVALSHKGRGRARLLGGLDRINAVGTGFNLYSGVAFLIGIGFAIRGVAMTLAGTFGDNMDAPSFKGPVYGEMFAVFAIMMLLVLGGGMLAIVGSREFASGMMVVTEVLMWGCLAALAWPVLRGVDWQFVKMDLGLHSGEGWGKEIGFGIAAYLCDLPLTLLVSGVVAWLVSMGGEEAAKVGVEGSPMFRPPGGSSWLAFTIGALGTVVWAPITEEIVFRGALYRMLRLHLPWIPSVLISAVIFGAMHGYDLPGLAGVATGGVIYGVLREYRGSLIASMTAHFLHNGTITLSTWMFLLALN